jgi:uncharacterized protein YxeA
MKKILIIITVALLGFGCAKIAVTTPIGDTGTPAIKFSIVTPTAKYPKISYSPNGAAEEFLSFSANDVKVKFEAPTAAPTDLYLDYKTNPAGLVKLNADGLANDPSYKPFFLLPDSTFKILVTKDTIRKGGQYAEKVDNNIVVYTQKIDASINYILPLTVTNSTYPSATGTGTIYYYIIGNPLAGTYNVVGTRYNCTATGDQGYSGGAIPGNFVTASIPTPKSLTPLSDTLVTTYVANLGAGTSRDYYLGYNPARSTTDVSVKFTQSFFDGISNIRLLTHTYDPALKKITLLWTYNNQPGGVGNDRIISEVFTKQ